MTLVEEAQRIAPELAAAAEEADQLRRLPDTTWKTLLESGMFRALQPARWGGGEVPLVEFLDAAIEVSRASASAGWVHGVIGVHPWQLALFEEEAQEEMWGQDPATMHSSSYAPSGKAEKVSGGYRLSGRWSFSSGCDHCKGVNLGVVAGGVEIAGKQLPDFRSMLLMPGDYTIVDVWHTAGMRGTGSKDILVEDVFVPQHRTQSHLDYIMDLPLPGQERNDGPLYRLPWAVVFNFALAASVFGAALGFMDVWVEQASTRATHFGSMVRDDAIMQQRLATAMWDVDASITKLRRDSEELWQAAEAGEYLSKQQRATMRWNANHGGEITGRAVAELFHAASGRSIFSDHALQRGFQDVQGMLGHAFLAPDALARTVGALKMGGEPVEALL